MKSLEYYSGDIALGCDPSPGKWEGDVFIAPDGSRWMADPDDDSDPRCSGTHTHWLVREEDYADLLAAYWAAQKDSQEALREYEEYLAGDVNL